MVATFFNQVKDTHFTHFVGIDVSKETLDFAVVATTNVLFHQQVSNDKKGRTNRTGQPQITVWLPEWTGTPRS